MEATNLTIPKFVWSKSLQRKVEVLRTGHFLHTVMVQLTDRETGNSSTVEVDYTDLETLNGHAVD